MFNDTRQWICSLHSSGDCQYVVGISCSGTQIHIQPIRILQCSRRGIPTSLKSSVAQKMSKKRSKQLAVCNATTQNSSARPSRQESLDFFLASLNDPNGPHHCGHCLYGALISFTGAPEKPTAIPPGPPPKLPLDVRRNLDFCNTLYRFLVTPRADAQVEALLTRLSTCSCQLADKRVAKYHETATTAEADVVMRMFIRLHAPEVMRPKFATARIAFIIQCFCTVYGGLVESGVKSVAKGTAQTWPMSPTDLIPFGPDELEVKRG